ncbi:ABC transporter permease [Bacillus sp. OxB-1]|uniref:ABC transporter permease n=1 Tax=Bacillus sp. (strain OxB-1) TaxID=98228 RepID=UPI000596DF78|nr:ABC transporter permease [Bacillus sp. OxB-1]
MRTNWMPVLLFRLRKEWKGSVIWLLFPILATILVVRTVGGWIDETKVPIALVVEEESLMAGQLADEIRNTELFDVQSLDQGEALHKLEQHELDSVFIIRRGYEESILDNQRNALIEAYSSNRSFAYPAVVETITSLAQQDAARSKAAYVVKHLFAEQGMVDEWNYEEVIEKSKERQQKEALIQTTFAFADETGSQEESDRELISIQGVWSLFSIIATFFLFDWMLKENRPAMRARWLFTSVPFPYYAVGMLVVYTAMLFVVDLVSFIVFNVIFPGMLKMPSVMALFAFRLTVNLLALLLAALFRQMFLFYVGGMAIALVLVVTGGAIIPIQAGRSFERVHPVQAFLADSVPAATLILLAGLLAIWIGKRRKAYA